MDLADCFARNAIPRAGWSPSARNWSKTWIRPPAGILGQAAHVDPFHVRTVNKDDMVEEVDLSDL